MTLRPNQINRHRERARQERAVLDAVHHVGTLSTVTDGRPWVVPMLYGRAGDRILMHGSVGAGALRYVAAGAPAALCVMHIDGWVYAHTLFDSSANYRSAVVHGRLVALSGDEAAEALTQISECLTPGRSGEVPLHTKKQLTATTALAMDIVEGQWTVKVRDAGLAVGAEGCGAFGAAGHLSAIRSAVTCPISAAAPSAMVSGSREYPQSSPARRAGPAQNADSGRQASPASARRAAAVTSSSGRSKTSATCSPASIPSARAAGMCSRHAATKRSCRAR